MFSFDRPETWTASQRVRDGDFERFPHHVAVAVGARAHCQVLYHQISHGRGVEDVESGPNTAGGDAVSGEEPGWRSHLLFPCAGQLGKVVRVER